MKLNMIVHNNFTVKVYSQLTIATLRTRTVNPLYVVGKRTEYNR